MDSSEKTTTMTITDERENLMNDDELDQQQEYYDSSSSLSPKRRLFTQQQRPIVVGYAFGPKKMSTMGVVMAEASKAKLSASHLMPPPAVPGTKSTPTTVTSLTEARLNDYDCDGGNSSSSTADMGIASDCNVKPESAYYRVMSTKSSSSYSGGGQNVKTNIVFTLGSSTDDGEGIGLSNIVRHFRSSCSSVCTTASTSTVTTCAGTMPSVQQHQQRTNSDDQIAMPIRVSFVPLDPDMPIEEQHGGTIDVILHKLTEDILCVAQLSTGNSLHVCPSNQQQLAAFRRVHRLVQFRNDHPECSLVDDPLNVQTLMSRADIADTLRKCLRNAQTTSGIPVRTPAYAVISSLSLESQPSIQELIRNSGLTFPIIVKPLVAAGTKVSHAMAVVMDVHGLQTVLADKVPCLCQEYTNHDACLFKVYVLGDHVSVHKRRSLPNLPRNQKSTRSFIEFDSQRPYPRLADFGFLDDQEIAVETARKRRRSLNTLVSPISSSSTATDNFVVTADEVMPVVVLLKEAFGLELFGFDILVACDDENESENDGDQSMNRNIADPHKRMLVVDVNYFPSYKEVPNFPWLLAKYLTDRAIENRRRANSAQDVSFPVNINR